MGDIMVRRGYGAARGAVMKPCIPAVGISPQLAPMGSLPSGKPGTVKK
jgi:hypothetical protein